MLTVQAILTSLPVFLEGLNNLVGAFAAVGGGICAVSGIKYLRILREKKIAAVFSFEAQLYAHLYELWLALSNNELLLTSLYSEDAKEDWGDKRNAQADELSHFYGCACETLKFIKSTPDQMPAYKDWGKDYQELIRFLVDVQLFDIRDVKNRFKFIKKCEIAARSEYWKSICALLKKLLSGIEVDQNNRTNDLFASESKN